MKFYSSPNAVGPTVFELRHCSQRAAVGTAHQLHTDGNGVQVEFGSIYRQIDQDPSGVSIELDLLEVGSEPVGLRCHYCQEDVMTKTLYRNTTITHITAVMLGIFFWWLCCCILPYVTKRWRNVEHYCGNCGRYLGVYTRSSII